MFGRVARSLCLGLGFLAVFVVPVFGVEVRIKDLVEVEGARANQLVGMGLVVGLAGTGDKGDMP